MDKMCLIHHNVSRLLVAAILCAFSFLVACDSTSSKQAQLDRVDVQPLLFDRAIVKPIPRQFQNLELQGVSPVTFNFSLLDAQIGSQFSLSLIGQTAQIRIDRRVEHANGDVTLTGVVENESAPNDVLITLGSQGGFGRIMLQGRQLLIRSDLDGSWLVDTHQAGMQVLNAGDDARINPNTNITVKATQTEQLATISPRASHTTIIDVMLVYSSGFREKYPGPNAQTRLNQLIETANTALLNSSVNMQFRLVHTLEVNHPDNVDNDTTLSMLSNGVAPFTEVETQRRNFGADLVAMIRPFVVNGSGSCGSAWLNGAEGSPLVAESAYSVVAEGSDGAPFCDDHTLAHELGHGLGSAHNVENATQKGYFVYSHGYGIPDVFGTVMSYFSPQSGRYSSPLIQNCGGNACGVADKADNVRAFEQTREIVANFFSATAVVDQPPDVTTLPPSAISSDSLTVSANVNPFGLTTTVWFEFGTSTTLGLSSSVRTLASDAVGIISNTLAGFACGTTIYYRVVAENSQGQSIGETVSAETQNCIAAPPVVTTDVAEWQADGSVILRGVVQPSGSTTVYFEYGLTSELGASTANQSIAGSVSIDVNSKINANMCGQTLFYRLTAENENGMTQGEVKSTNAPDCLTVPELSSIQLSQISDRSARAQVDVLSSGSDAELYFRFGEVGAQDRQTTVQNVVANERSTLFGILDNLLCGQTYEVVAIATNSQGETQSSKASLSTLACSNEVPSVTMLEATLLSPSTTLLVAEVRLSSPGADVFFELGNAGVFEIKTVSQNHPAASGTFGFSAVASGLKCGNSYQARATVSSSSGRGVSNIFSFTTPACGSPLTSTLAVTESPVILGQKRVRFQATVDPDGQSSEVYFEYGPDKNYGQQTPTFNIGGGTLPRPASWQIDALQCAATYHYRVVVTRVDDANIRTTQKGNDIVFTTEACSLQFSRVQMDFIADTSALISALLMSNGESTTVHAEYGRQITNLDIQSQPKVIAGGSVQAPLVNLQCNAEYFVRLVATNSAVDIVSEIVSFRTQLCSTPPLVGAPLATEINLDSAVVQVQVTSNNAPAVVHFEYGAGGLLNQRSADKTLLASFAAQNVSQQLSSLRCATLYQVRVVVTTERGSASSNPITFTTAECLQPPNAPSSERSGLSAGVAHNLALTKTGTLVSWGDNQFGQLGRDQAFVGVQFALSDASDQVFVDAKKVKTGAQHSLVLTQLGEVFSWGLNDNGQLGSGNLFSRTVPMPVLREDNIELTNIVDIAAGAAHSIALDSSGQVWVWGDNLRGQLGDPTVSEPLVFARVLAGLPSNIVSVAAGHFHSFALTSDGNLYAWGANEKGQLGNNLLVDQLTPILIEGLTLSSVVGGAEHSLGLNKAGDVYAWGGNANGQLGLGDWDDRTTPQRIPLAANSQIKQISAGAYFSIALQENGSLLAWGANTEGQLGNGNFEANPEPRTVMDASSLAPLRGNLNIAAGGQHVVTLNEAGNVVAWGSNAQGQLGQSKIVSSPLPMLVRDTADQAISLKLPGFIITPQILSIPEGETREIKIRMTAPPDSLFNATVTLDGDNDLRLLSESVLAFSQVSWQADKIIQLEAQADTDTEVGNALLTISGPGMNSAQAQILEEERRLTNQRPRQISSGGLGYAGLLLLSLVLLRRVGGKSYRLAMWR